MPLLFAKPGTHKEKRDGEKCDDSCGPRTHKRAPVHALQTLQRYDEKEETQPGKAQFKEIMFSALHKRFISLN